MIKSSSYSLEANHKGPEILQWVITHLKMQGSFSQCKNKFSENISVLTEAMCHSRYTRSCTELAHVSPGR